MHYCKHEKLYNKIYFVHAKQSLGAISVTHTQQFSEHTDSFEYRSREAVIHSLKHEFLIDNWHLMNRMPNKIRPALRTAPYRRLHALKKYAISRYISDNFVFIIQTLSYKKASPIQ